MENKSEYKFIYPGIFLLSAASLNLELTYTRIFSLSQGYYFAFMVVSIALLGIGASGSFLMVYPTMVNSSLFRFLSHSSLAFSVSALCSYAVTNHIPFDPVRISWDWQQIIWIGTYYLLLALPFFFTGLTLATIFSRFPFKINFFYFSDLLGAGIGCWIIYLTLSFTNEPGAVLISVGMGGLASLFFGISSVKLLRLPVLWLIGVMILLFSPPQWLQMNISPYRSLMAALKYPGARLISTQWDAHSRVDVVDSPAVRFAPGLSLRFKNTLPAQMGLVLDAGQLNAVTSFNGDKKTLLFTSYLPTALPYVLKSINSCLCLDPRGGLDILTAICHDVKSIEAVCPDPLIYKTMRDGLGKFSGDLYSHKNVTVHCGGIRSFFYHCTPKYDVIQCTLTDVSGALTTGIYGLSENYTLTSEAISAYYDHLNEGGFLLFSCYLIPPPRTEFRLIALLVNTLESVPNAFPYHQLMVISSWGTMVTIVKKGRITPDECSKLKEFCQRRGFDVVYYPGINEPEANRYNRFLKPLYFEGVQKLINPRTRKKFVRDYPFDLSPVSDNNPFFNQFFKLTHVREAYTMFGKKWQPFFEGEYILPFIFSQAFLLSIILILAPLFFLPKKEPENGKFFLLYFIWIGIGFIGVEIVLIQRFILLFDHPVKSVTMVISGLLVSAGVGSSFSGKMSNRFPRIIRTIPFVTGGIILIYATSLRFLLEMGLAAEPIVRTGCAFLMIFPLGFLMGMPFPLGITALGKRNPRLIPWAWGTNGCASVTGSVLAVMIALSGGFSAVFFASGSLYLLAGLWLRLYYRHFRKALFTTQ